jgi:solute carrier family 25 folate transporter 32
MASGGSVGSTGPDEGNPNSNKLAASEKPQGAPITNSRLARFSAGLSDTYVNSMCGAVAGAASGLVTCPLDVIKTKLQAQGSFRKRTVGMTGASPSPYRGLYGTASTVWAQEGVKGFYRGLGPMMIGYLPTWAVYMGVYNKAKDYYYTQFGKTIPLWFEVQQDLTCLQIGSGWHKSQLR